MATRSDVLGRLRVWLEDTGPAPLWTDEELIEALRAQLDQYSHWNPEERSMTATLEPESPSLPLPDGVLSIVRVVDPGGLVLPQRAAAPIGGDTTEAAAWEVFGNALHVVGHAVPGSYTIWYEAARTFPDQDNAPFPVPEGDLSLIVTGAVVWALEFRAREEWKRGTMPPRYEHRLNAARREFRARQRAMSRRLRVRTVTVSG